MVGLRHVKAFREGVDEYGRPLTVEDRETLLAPYLPEAPVSRKRVYKTRKRRPQTKSFRELATTTIHALIFQVIHFLFSIYIRLRKAWRNIKGQILAIMYYHHRTPELIRKDVRHLKRLPRHLSIVLDLQEDAQKGGALESLVNDLCECSAWSACAGIPMLSIYERTGTWISSLQRLFQCMH